MFHKHQFKLPHIFRINGHNLTKFCIHIIIWDFKNVNFGKFATELGPFIDVRIWFLLNILRINKQRLTKFCIHIIIFNQILYTHYH